MLVYTLTAPPQCSLVTMSIVRKQNSQIPHQLPLAFKCPAKGQPLARGYLHNDVTTGLGGDDIICGVSGNDSLNGGSVNDAIFGGNDDITALCTQGKLVQQQLIRGAT